MVTEAGYLQRDIERLSASLDTLNKRLVQIFEVEMPGILEEFGLTEARLSTGERITVANKIYTSISEAHQSAAFAWLKEHGLGDIIKTVTKTAVHPSTLRAQIRDLLEAGEDVPMDLFSVHQKRVAEIST
jgi:hypothetical protein